MKFITQIKEKQEQIKTLRKELNNICDNITTAIEQNVANQQTNKYTAHTVRHTDGFSFIVSIETPNKTIDLSDLKSVNRSFKKLNFHFCAPSEDLDKIIEICRKTLESPYQ